jgi:very-short-patch-repair endonuclease
MKWKEKFSEFVNLFVGAGLSTQPGLSINELEIDQLGFFDYFGNGNVHTVENDYEIAAGICAVVLKHAAYNTSVNIGNCMLMCDSPIERALLGGIIGVSLFRWDAVVIKNCRQIDMVPDEVVIDTRPQWKRDYRGSLLPIVECQKSINQYRVDFIVTLGGQSVIVECDGHDFHEKTKDQARNDKRRDRELQQSGHRIFRFAGSEIFESPLKSSESIIQFLENANQSGSSTQ